MENVIEYNERLLIELEELLEKEKQEALQKQRDKIEALKKEYEQVPCDCCIPDEMGNYDPCCNRGKHTADPKLKMCICCGADMFEERGFWFKYDQENIPFSKREPQDVWYSRDNE